MSNHSEDHGMTLVVKLAFLVIITAGASAQPVLMDTVWYRTNKDLEVSLIQGCAIGGVPQIMILVNHYPGGGNLIHELNMATGQIEDTFDTGHWGPVMDVAMASKANVIATAEVTNLIRIWQWPEKTMIREIRDTGNSNIPHIALTSDGRKLFNATSNKMFDVETGEVLWVLPQRGSAGVTPIITPDDRYLISAVHNLGGNGALLMDVETGEHLATFPGGNQGGSISAVGISDDGRYVAVFRPWEPGFGNGTLVVYDRDNQIIVLDTVYGDVVESNFISFMPDNRFIVTNTNQADYTNGVDAIVYPVLGEREPTIIRYGCYQHDQNWNYLFGNTVGRVWLSRANLDAVSVPVSIQPESGPLTVIPNPSSGNVEIKGINAGDGPVDVALSDIDGKQVLIVTEELRLGSLTLETAVLPKGTYALVVSRSGERLVSTIIVLQ